MKLNVTMATLTHFGWAQRAPACGEGICVSVGAKETTGETVLPVVCFAHSRATDLNI